MTSFLKHITIYFVLVLGACTGESVFPKYDYSDATLKVKAPQGLTAGNPISFYTATEEKEKSELLLIIDNGLKIKSIRCYNNRPISLPVETFTQAGIYTIRVSYNGQVIANKKLKIKADEVIDPIEIYTGPSTILVGGKQASMITAIPTDKYDNGITEKIDLQFESDKAKGIKSDITVENLYAALEFDSELKVQKVHVGISKNSIASTEQTVKEIADWAADYKMEIIEQYPYADNRQYTKLRTSRIFDPYGNQIADGTLVNFEIYSLGKLVGNYKAITIDGVANIYIRNPSEPETWEVRSSIGDYSSSNVISLSYKNALQELVWSYDDFQKTISVGPLRAMLGQFVPDGTVVSIHSKGNKYSAETYGGYALFELIELGILDREKIKLSCSGLEEEIQL